MVQIVLLATALFCLLLGITVLLNNPRSQLFRIYLVFSITSALWMAVNGLVVGYPIVLSDQALLIFGQLITPFSLLASLSFFLFLKVFTANKISRKSWFCVVPTLAVCLFSFTPYNVYLDDQGHLALGSLYPFYLMVLMFNIFLIFHSIFNKTARMLTKDPQKSRQLTYLRIGTFATVIPAVLFGSFLPLISTSTLSNIGPVFSVAFLIFAGVAIVRHHLFDIRLIVARALAYILLLSTLIGLYSLAVFGLANHFLGTESVFAQQVVPILSAIFLVFTAPFFKRLFDKITNHLFYQDAYDPQTLLDDLNKVLLGNIELSILLRHASAVIQQHLKSEMCLVAVKQVPSAPMRIVGTMDPHLSEEEMHIFRHDLGKQDSKITSVEDIPPHSRLSRLLRLKNIALIVRLQTSHDTKGDALAYIILGSKRSGNIYNKQDFRIIEIIADEMVIAIQNALRFEEIQGFAATLQERVNEATAKLKRTNAKLKEMDETKDEFISMASHQLRTPLTSVKGYLSMVLEGDTGKVSPAQQKLLDQAFISSQRMVYLIADLLNVSRLKTGKFVITSAPTNLADVVEGELSQLTEVAKGKKVKMTYKKPKNFSSLMLDETKIRQVIMNFADNAIYYTPSGGKVNIEVKEDRNNVYFTVKDDGMGIPRADQKHLFTKFYRASNARQVRPDGTGLGLFMAKKVVAAQGGTVLFESTEGKGSTFGFSFSKSKLKVPISKS